MHCQRNVSLGTGDVRSWLSTTSLSSSLLAHLSTTCPVFADVSNAANGGQVLMDEPTFTAVKEELWRLGLVTSTGLNYDMLYNASSSGTRSRRSSIGSSSSRDDATTASSAARLLECWNGRR